MPSRSLQKYGMITHNSMKYASVFATIVVIWVAVIIIAFVVPKSEQRLQLFLLVNFFTLVLFVIGFRKRR